MADSWQFTSLTRRRQVATESGIVFAIVAGLQPSLGKTWNVAQRSRAAALDEEEFKRMACAEAQNMQFGVQ